MLYSGAKGTMTPERPVAADGAGAPPLMCFRAHALTYGDRNGPEPGGRGDALCAVRCCDSAQPSATAACEEMPQSATDRVPFLTEG
jgi:hypothetical protein